jgi:hypothetical protein
MKVLSGDMENFLGIKIRPDKDPGARHFLGDANGDRTGRYYFANALIEVSRFFFAWVRD